MAVLRVKIWWRRISARAESSASSYRSTCACASSSIAFLGAQQPPANCLLRRRAIALVTVSHIAVTPCAKNNKAKSS
jgi:hypothetical protein